MRRDLLRLLGPSIVAPLAALVISGVVISLTTDRFLVPQNLLNVSLQVSIVAIIAVGATIVILTGGIDLSAGSMVALLSMLMAMLVKEQHVPLASAVPLVIVLGGALGAVNGLLATYGRIPSFVATLATLSIYKGWAFLFNNGSPIFSVSPSLDPLFYGKRFGLPLPLYYVVALYLLAFTFLNYTIPGRAIYAVGGNQVAAVLSGINVRRTRLLAFIIAGCMTGIASILMTARLNSGSPNYGAGMELQAIGAAVIGGASLVGGYGNVISTLFGALTIVVVQNGLNLNAVSTTWQSITLGIIIALAVGIDGWRGEIRRLFLRLVGRRRATPEEGRPPGEARAPALGGSAEPSERIRRGGS
jgi:ribose transport system permease protein